MKGWVKKILILIAVLFYVVGAGVGFLLLYPDFLANYLLTLVNDKYLDRFGLEVVYDGFHGDMFDTLGFRELTLHDKSGALGLQIRNAELNLDFLRLLKRDLSCDWVTIDSLRVTLSPAGSQALRELNIGDFPRISIGQLSVGYAAIESGETLTELQIDTRLTLDHALRLLDCQLQVRLAEQHEAFGVSDGDLSFDGQELIIHSGELAYLGSRARVSGQVRLVPEVEFELSVETSALELSANLPGWLAVKGARGTVSGSPEQPHASLALDIETQGKMLDRANIQFYLTEEKLVLTHSDFRLGSGQIEASGEIYSGGQVDLSTRFKQAALADFFPAVPAVTLSGETALRWNWQESPGGPLTLELDLDSLNYDGYTLYSPRAMIRVKDQLWTSSDTVTAQFAGTFLRATGAIDMGAGTLNLAVSMQTDTLSTILERLGIVPVKGAGNGIMWVQGALNNPSFSGTFSAHRTGYGGITAQQAFIQFDLDSSLSQIRGMVSVSAENLTIAGVPAESGEAEFSIAGDSIFADYLRLYQGLENLETSGLLVLGDSGFLAVDTIVVHRNAQILTVDGLRANRNERSWTLEPATFHFGDSNGRLSGEWLGQGHFDITLSARRIQAEGLSRFLGKVPDYYGIVDADLRLAYRADDLSLAGNLTALGGSAAKVPFDSAAVTFSLRASHLRIEEFIWTRGAGRATAAGLLTFAPEGDGTGGLGALDSVDIRGQLSGFELVDLQPVIPWDFEIGGRIDGPFALTGLGSDPSYEARLSISEPRFYKNRARSLTGKLVYRQEQLVFQNLRLSTSTGIYTGGGFLPADLRLTAGRPFIPLDKPIELSFAGTTNQLDFLTPYFEVVDSLNGSYALELRITGTVHKPIRNGWLRVSDGTVELLNLENPIYGVAGSVTLTDNQLVVNELTGYTINESTGNVIDRLLRGIERRLAGGSRWGDGPQLELTGAIDMSEFFRPRLDLQLRGREMYFATPLKEIEGIGDANFTIVGRDTIQIRGDFIPAPGELVVRTEISGQNEFVFEAPNTGTLIAYDIHVPLDGGVRISNSEIKADVDGDITLTAMGSESFRYAGNLNVISGTFEFNGQVFTISEGRVTFEPSIFNPSLDIRATTDIVVAPGTENEEVMAVGLLITGDLDDPTVTVDPTENSTTTLTQSDILEILSLGSQFQDVPGQTATSFFGPMLQRGIEQNTRRLTGLDRFQIKRAGAKSSGEGQAFRVNLGKRITPRLYVGFGAVPTVALLNPSLGFSQTEIQAAYRLNRNMSLVGSVDPDGLYQFSYRLKYRY